MFEQNPIYWVYAALYLLGMSFALAKKRRWLIWFVWPISHAIAYMALGIPRAFWYFAVLVPGFVMGASLGLGKLFHRSKPLRYPIGNIIVRWGGVVFLVGAFWVQGNSLMQQGANLDPRFPSYRAAGLWLQENTPEDASIGLLEFGVIGYYAHPREMIDFTGLLFPKVAAQLSSTFLYSDSAVWVAETFDPDYFVLLEGHYNALIEDYWAGRCHLEKTFSSDRVENLLIYACDSVK